MIDPRALQQHFNKVRLKEKPPEPSIPRIPDPEPLTTIQAIPVPKSETVNEQIQPIVDTSELQKELLEVTQALTTLKQALTQTPQIEPVTITVPVSVTTVVTELKEETKQKKQIKQQEDTYGFSIPETKESDDYNPYGYYSGPRF